MATNIERLSQNQVSKGAESSRGNNAVMAGILTGRYFADRAASRPGSNGEPSRAHWENMDAYANREHQRRLDYLTKSHELSPEGTFASGVEYGDRGTKNAYTQRRAEPAAKAPAKGRTRQTSGTPPKPSTGSKSRGAEVGAQIGGAIGTALGAAVPVAGETGASEVVGGALGAKAGEAVGSAVSNAIAKSKAKKADAAAAPAKPAATSKPTGSSSGGSRSPKPAGASYTTDIKFGLTK